MKQPKHSDWQQPDRRNFIKLSVLAGSSMLALTLPACGSDNDKQPVDDLEKSNEQPPEQTQGKLSQTQQRFIQAFAEVIIPKDEDPGAESVDVLGLVEADLEAYPEHLEILTVSIQYVENFIAQLYPNEQQFTNLRLDQKEYLFRAFVDKTEGEDVLNSYDPEGVFYNLFIMIFERTRNAFYCTQVGYDMLGYTPPIQGYPDFAKKPER